MKKKQMLLALGLVLGASPLNVQAHGCWSGCGFWPFFGFSLGFGLASSYADYEYYRHYPVYSYPAYAAYPVNAVATDPPVTRVPAPTPPPPVPEPTRWVPSTPGASHWVLDPSPFSYSPSTVAKPQTPIPAPQTVSVTHSKDGVPVYVIGR